MKNLTSPSRKYIFIQIKTIQCYFRDKNVAEMTDVQRLMVENQNLLETKNALNIVKDDLLQELDQIANKYAKVKIELENAKKEKGKHQTKEKNFEAKIGRP